MKNNLLCITMQMLLCMFAFTNAQSQPKSGTELKLKKFGLETVFIQGGDFIMGCDSKTAQRCDDNNSFLHTVSLSNFKINKYEISNALFYNVMGYLRSITGDKDFSGGNYLKEYPNHPVINVIWQDASDFCAKLSQLTGKKYRLPTEAEWEYVASERLGQRNSSPNISIADSLLDAGHLFWEINKGDKNALGIYNMFFPFSEWCSDWYQENYYSISSIKNPKGPIAGTEKSTRGCNVHSSSYMIMPGYRSSDSITSLEYAFRVVEEVTQ